MYESDFKMSEGQLKTDIAQLRSRWNLRTKRLLTRLEDFTNNVNNFSSEDECC